MVKHTQTIRRQFADDCLSVFDHFIGLALKGLRQNPDCLYTFKSFRKDILNKSMC